MTGDFFLIIQEIFLLFAEDVNIVIAAFITMLLFFLLPGNKKLKQFFLYPTIVLLIFINNPITIYLIVEKGLISAPRYVRLYWLLPVTFVLAYLCVKLVTRAKKWKRIAVAVLCSGIIIYTGNYMFAEESYTKITNLYKIPNDVIEICDFIDEDIAFNQKEQEEIRIVVPYYFSSYIHQYNGKIKTLYGRHNDSPLYYSIGETLRQLIEAPELDVEAICAGAHESECDYIVVDANKPKKGKFIKYDYEKLIETEDYVIYKQVDDKIDKK